MMNPTTRRTFLVQSVGAAAAAAIARGARAQEPAAAGVAPSAGRAEIRKALYWGMFPESMTAADRFRLARDAGFEGVEVPTIRDQKLLDEMRKASEASGVRVHSIMNSDHWSQPLSSADPEVVRKGIACMEMSMRNAKALGADTVLLVPAVVNPQTPYNEAWTRSTGALRDLAAKARDLGIVIGIEDVWNKFLLSPREFAEYVDQFQTPHVRAYFDIGNIVAYGYPQDWIRTLGKRIVKLHVKDFDAGKHKFVPLLEGSIDWKEVRRALDEIGYKGFMTAELPGGDEKYLRDVSERMSRIIEGRT